MQLKINVPNELVEEARVRNVSTEVYIEELLARQISEKSTNHASPQTINDAIETIRQLSKGNTLGELKIKDLVEEGRKY